MSFTALSTKDCPSCRRTFRPQNEGQHFCSRACAEASRIKLVAKESVKRLHPVEMKHRGDWAELIACAWLMERGYQVFRNVSSRGPIDLVAMKGVETLYIDVKNVAIDMLTSREKIGEARARKGRLSDDQQAAGIRLLYVSPDGICSFDLAPIQAAYTTAFKHQFTDRA